MKMESRRQISVLLTAAAASIIFVASTNVSGFEAKGEETLMKLVFKCLKADDVGICLKWKAANALKRLVDAEEPLSLTDYLILVRKPKSLQNSSKDEAVGKRALDIKPWENETVQNEKLDDFIWEKLAALVTTRTIQISLPETAFQGRASVDKLFKKSHGYFMATMMGSMIMKIALAKVAFIAGKAFIMAKIALILSLIVGLRRLLGNVRGLGNVDAELIYSSAEQEANGWQRRRGFDYRRGDHGGHLAYNAYSHANMNQY